MPRTSEGVKTATVPINFSPFRHHSGLHLAHRGRKIGAVDVGEAPLDPEDYQVSPPGASEAPALPFEAKYGALGAAEDTAI